MTNNYDDWFKCVKPEIIFSECKNVGRYMVVPVDADDGGNIYQAKTKKCYSSKEALEAIKKIKVLYTITVFQSVLSMFQKGKPKFKERNRGYLVRGVW